MEVRETQPQADERVASAALDVSAAGLRSLISTLRHLATVPSTHLPAGCDDDAQRIEQLSALESIKAAADAAIARVSVDFDASQRDLQRNQGVHSRQRGRGIADQIALARRVTPWRASRDLRTAKGLRACLPDTFAHLVAGRICRDAAAAVHDETSHLDGADRRQVDNELAGRLPDLSVRQARQAARQSALKIDPATPTRRHERSVQDRRVTMRPLPDAMCEIVATLPAVEGAAVLEALRTTAAGVIADGDADGCGLGQLMADLLVTRTTGQTHARAVRAEIQLVMTPDALLSQAPDADQTAWLAGYGPVPAAIARAVVAGSPKLFGPWPDEIDEAQAWVRRLFTDPMDGTLVDADPSRRRFHPAVARFIRMRDRECRVPFCDSPIRELDHAHDHHLGGPSSVENGLGVCQRFNHVKQLPGWSVTITHDDRGDDNNECDGLRPGHTATITTPTGHTYTSRAPAQPVTTRSRDLPPSAIRPAPVSRMEQRLIDTYWCAAA